MRGATLTYLDNRSDHEYTYPPQHEFAWKRATRDMQRPGKHPHISLEDKVFVETTGGDLTIKVENNTADGRGVYSEPVANKDQTLDDAELYYAVVGQLVLLKIRPYQEPGFRYLLYNTKLRQARRLDALADACVLLPDGHGLIFPHGYYLQTGDGKQFDHVPAGLVFEKRVASPNGEDFLYVFFQKDNGIYLLLSYNLISQQVGAPIVCHGYALFENGELCYFRADDEPRKHHAVQLWQTPYPRPRLHPTDPRGPGQLPGQARQQGNRAGHGRGPGGADPTWQRRLLRRPLPRPDPAHHDPARRLPLAGRAGGRAAHRAPARHPPGRHGRRGGV